MCQSKVTSNTAMLVFSQHQLTPRTTVPPIITVVGGVFMVEHLNIYKIIIEKVAKYLLLPGIELDINLNIRVSV